MSLLSSEGLLVDQRISNECEKNTEHDNETSEKDLLTEELEFVNDLDLEADPGKEEVSEVATIPGQSS